MTILDSDVFGEAPCIYDPFVKSKIEAAAISVFGIFSVTIHDKINYGVHCSNNYIQNSAICGTRA